MSSSGWNSYYFEQVSPERLILAADAILAADQLHGKGTVAMWKDDSRPAREGFSSHELVEAMKFLRRLGLIACEPQSGRR
jgi:hypothetical protein